MSFRENNIEVLKQYYMDVYHKIYEEAAGPGYPELEIRSETALNGEKVLSLNYHDQYYRINSSYSPSHEADIWVEQFDLAHMNNIITVFGLGNGLLIQRLTERLNEEDRLFIYEPAAEIFRFVMEEYDITDILADERVLLTIEGINDYDFHNVLQYSLNLTNMYHINRSVLPHYEEIFTESCVVFFKEIRDIMFYTQVNINTEVNFGPRYLVNCFHNMKYLKDCYILRDIATEFRTELPAIIVAAGPSVQENIEELKRAKGKAYIFAVDRVLDYLLDEGVEPDFTLTVDPIKPVKYFSRREDITIPLITEMASNHEILELHQGEKIFFNCNYYYRQMFDAAGKYQPYIMTGASVATVAFSVCAHVGFKTIVLVGHDLAYDGDVTHAGGVEEKGANIYDFMVEGVDGKEVRSRHDWKEFIRWYYDMGHMFTDITVIDTKKKGAKIYNTVMMSLKEAIDRYGAKDDNRIARLYSEDKKCFDGKTFEKACAFIKESLEDLDQIGKKAKEAMKLCDQQISAYEKSGRDSELTIKNYTRLSKINKYIEGRPVYDLVDNIITSMNADDLSAIYKLTKDEKNDKLDAYIKSKKMYQATLDGVDYIKPRLKDALEQINS